MLYFTIQRRLQDGIEEGPRSGGCEMTILSSDIVGLSSDYGRIVFLLAEALQGVSDAQDFVAGAVFGEVGG